MSTDRARTTYTDLLGWPDDGRRYELYDGEVSVVPAPFPRHQIALLELHRRLYDYAERHGGIVLASPIDIVFTESTVLEPDIVFFTAARRHHVELDRAIRVPPDVAVEVISPGTAANDRGRKLKVFEQFGVPEYWILDPHEERLDVLALRDARYAPAISAGRGAAVTSVVLAGFTCEAATLFPW